MYRHLFKRMFDLFVSIFVLIGTSPVLFVIVIGVGYVNKNTGIFFLQKRPGKGGKLFHLIKFKTMTDERDAAGNLLSDADRLTPIGRFIRSTSLDELPQLINVLKGEMTLVGPRPLLPHYLSLYSPEQARRHEVRPGITGWAQVTGYRGETKELWQMEGRVMRDIWYIEHWTFLLDLYIMYKTVYNAIHGEKEAY